MKYNKISSALITILAIVSIFLHSCESIDTIEGNGQETTELYNFGKFGGVEVEGVFEVKIVPDSTFDIEITTDENIQPYVKTKLENGIIYISMKENVTIDESSSIKVEIHCATLNTLEVSGITNVRSIGQLKQSVMTIKNEGVGTINMDLVLNDLRLYNSGIGNIELNGKALKTNIISEGNGKVNAYNFYVDEMDIASVGTGVNYVYVSNKLAVKIEGAGQVYCKGSPNIITEQITGIGKLHLK
ncbi:MAG: DUF2807 domain-containing protein [Bacteroidales bacterium]|nr:DUF2807 domain-containing protein [Bacteroidales bacterium]